MGAKDGNTTDVQDRKTKKKTESKFDPQVLRQMVKDGLNAAEIMIRLQLKTRQTLKQHIAKLIQIDRQLYEVKGLYLKDSKRPRINQFGFLKINMKVQDLGDLKIEEGDQFNVEVLDGKIILTKLIP
ncbi:hypothetical protein [Solidesulfovibrio alcoholivorans]|uniref:hypothetical protein n=1 Tax=Solidesulfovibrio alcoholivorans TaxID=81406 RepID=UPI00049548F5|nr:hypothetical protein [Solidesulfovibrio alcoholivorans]